MTSWSALCDLILPKHKSGQPAFFPALYIVEGRTFQPCQQNNKSKDSEKTPEPDMRSLEVSIRIQKYAIAGLLSELYEDEFKLQNQNQALKQSVSDLSARIKNLEAVINSHKRYDAR